MNNANTTISLLSDAGVSVEKARISCATATRASSDASIGRAGTSVEDAAVAPRTNVRLAPRR